LWNEAFAVHHDSLQFCAQLSVTTSWSFCAELVVPKDLGLRGDDRRADAMVSPTRSKAAIIDNLALMLEEGLVTLPRSELWPEGIDELEAFEYSVTDNGNVRTGAPSGIHDDCVIAFALAVWMRRPGGCQVPEIYP
jgi:hypothetical protein